MTSIEPDARPTPRAAAHYCVHFIGGTSIRLKAANPLKAEQQAIRQRPGIVRKVVFLGKASA